MLGKNNGRSYSLEVPKISYFYFRTFVPQLFFAMNMLERITIIPDLCNGEPTIRGMRVTVKAIVEYIAAGETKESLLKAYPHLSDNDINAAVEYASGHLL